MIYSFTSKAAFYPDRTRYSSYILRGLYTQRDSVAKFNHTCHNGASVVVIVNGNVLKLVAKVK